MFCKECGAKVSKTTNFCPKCGTALKEAPAQAASQKEKAAPVPAPAPAPATANAPAPKKDNTGPIIFVAVFVGAILIIAFAAMDAGSNYDDYSSDSDYTSDTTGGGGTTYTGNGCTAGYCNSNGHCCPSYAQYYCNGSCYYTSNDALSVGGASCSSYKIVC